MGLSRSLSISASSMAAHQQRFDVISNNIANSSTIGYKSNRANFSEQFNQIMNYGSSADSIGGNGVGGVNPYQQGLGVQLASITQNMNQGTIETTSRPLDLAIEGEGYFIYDINGDELYSRAGAITQDDDGYLVDAGTGAYLQGYSVDADENGNVVKDANGINVLNRTLSNIQIPSNIVSQPLQTQNIQITGNLNSLDASGTERTTSIEIYDNLGGARTLSFTFTKGTNANEYTVTAAIDGTAVNLANNTITFNSDGTINTPTSLSLTAADLNTALGSTVFDDTTPKDLTVNLVGSNTLIGQQLTNFSAPNTATATQADGYEIGSLEGISIDDEGKIWGSFTNSQSEILGQVVLAQFNNPSGLIREGGNFLSKSPNSGDATYGTAGEIFSATSIAGNSLEQSNVDLTEEFVDMISTQRGFEAASRGITVTDQILAIINQLKR